MKLTYEIIPEDHDRNYYTVMWTDTLGLSEGYLPEKYPSRPKEIWCFVTNYENDTLGYYKGMSMPHNYCDFKSTDSLITLNFMTGLNILPEQFEKDTTGASAYLKKNQTPKEFEPITVNINTDLRQKFTVELKEKTKDVREVRKHSTDLQVIESFLKSKITEPFQVSEIDKLEFTSGVGKEIDEHKKCDSSITGLYGSYYLIDQNYADRMGRPVGGVITIYLDNKMAGWQSTDTNQTIWEIHLESSVIAVWDSIKVGMTRSEIEKFGKANNGFCVKKGDALYACDFNNFSAVYIFKNDTLNELTVTRKCEKETKN
jgi:hypothetical protein